ncbi:MAG: TatD family hydrolase [bacterium]
MIDTHSHIYGEEYKDDRDEVVANAQAAGVEHIILANVDAETIMPLLECNKTYPEFTSMAMGLHPTSVDNNYLQQLNLIEKQLFSAEKFVAVGEIGIDLYWDATYQHQQEEAFAKQIDWAIELNLPIIIHVRKAYAEVLKVLNRFSGKELRGVFHCFGGGIEEAKKVVSMGFYLGIGGVVTYKNSNLGDVIKPIGLDHILLETDAPYLSPVPYRGKRNEPKNLVHINDKIASIFQEKNENVDFITTRNAKMLFNL